MFRNPARVWNFKTTTCKLRRNLDNNALTYYISFDIFMYYVGRYIIINILTEIKALAKSVTVLRNVGFPRRRFIWIASCSNWWGSVKSAVCDLIFCFGNSLYFYDTTYSRKRQTIDCSGFLAIVHVIFNSANLFAGRVNQTFRVIFRLSNHLDKNRNESVSSLIARNYWFYYRYIDS